MFYKFFFFFIVFRGAVSLTPRNEQECSFQDDSYKQFATKTAYSMIKGELDEDDYKVAGKFNFLSYLEFIIQPLEKLNLSVT